MKILIAVLAGMAVSDAAFAETAADDGVIELVGNGSMERLDPKGVPLGWGDGDCRVMKEPDGNHFIRIVQKNPGKMTCVYRKHEIPAGCAELAVSLRGRVSGLIPGEHPWFDTRVIINVKDASGKVVKGDCVDFPRDTAGWERKAKRVALPEGAAVLEYMIAAFNCKACAFDVDDVRVTLLKKGAKLPEEAEGQPRESVLPKVTRPALTEADGLSVRGNRLVNKAGKEVWLQGVAVPSLSWMAAGEHVMESVAVAVEEWGANVIRLPLHSKFWFATATEPWNKRDDGGEAYRTLVDRVVAYANVRGCYVVLDLHEYRAATANHARFWGDCAKRYANRPGVLFDILNEPHGISWCEWRDGGTLKDGGGNAPAETEEGRDVRESIGMQRLVEAVRATGARNVIIAGGLDWSYDCSGILEGYALQDPSGNGIAYSVHVYPWKGDWQKKFLDCAEKYPLFLGEVGCMLKKMPFEQTLKDPYRWAPDMLACIQKRRLNWTAWSFHPSADPCVILDWNYTPTPAWGAFVRAALGGARFESDRLR
ncbi:MAG: cellulase family glycosylhydrolase [Kiritimatiellae bacterium]|nr:cellulase family glycosylhydrolase [Kiritimatiellia bacterium]